MSTEKLRTIEDWVAFLQKEYHIAKPELIDKLILTEDGTCLMAYDALPEEEVFLVREDADGTTMHARYFKRDIVRYGGEDYQAGLAKALGLYAAADLSQPDAWRQLMALDADTPRLSRDQ